MRLEDNWRSQIQNSDYNNPSNRSDYIKDKSLEEDSSIFTKVLGASAILLAGKKAFDKGYFAKIASEAIDTFGTKGIKNFDNYTSSRDFIGRSLKTIQDDLPGLKQAFEKTQFNGLEDIANSYKVSLSNSFDSIKDDWDNVTRKMSKDSDGYSLENSDFDYYMDEIEQVTSSLNSNKKTNNVFMDSEDVGETINSVRTSPEDASFEKEAKDKMYDKMKEVLTVSPEEKISDYNKTKTTKVTFGDIFEVKEVESVQESIGKDRGMTLPDGTFIPDNKIDVDGNPIKNTKTTTTKKMLVSKNDDFKIKQDELERLNKRLRFKNSKGESLLDNFEDLKNMRIDSALRKTKSGEIRDLRGAREKINNFSKVFTDDLKIPFIGLNPLKMLGISDGIFKRKKLFAGINQGTNQHVLTDMLKSKDGYVSKTGGKYRAEILKDFVYIDGDVFANKSGRMDKVASDMEILTIANNPHKKNMPKQADTLRKMMNEPLAEIEKFNFKDNPFRATIGKAAEWLDIGFQDTARDKVTWTQPMSYGNVLGELTNKITKSKKKRNILEIFGSHSNADNNTNILINRTATFKDLVSKNTGKNAADFFKQLFAGRKDPRNISTATLKSHYLIERLNSMLSSFGMGLSTENLGSIGQTTKNLLTKRVLPVYAAHDMYQYANMKSEELTGKQMEDKAAEVFVGADIGMAKVRDALGITALAKKISPLLPGGEQITELPGVGGLFNWDDTEEEKRDFWENGETAIRNGRWWSLGNTAFTGGKTKYYSPNAYRRIKGDAKYTDAKFGSRKEYLKHITWMPNLENKLGLDKILFPENNYHFEMKHYNDRPYLKTGGALDQVPIFGPVLEKAFGELIKPEKKMHLEYWDKNSLQYDKERKGRKIKEDIKAKMIQESVINRVDNENFLEDSSYRLIEDIKDDETLSKKEKRKLINDINEKKASEEKKFKARLIKNMTDKEVKEINSTNAIDVLKVKSKEDLVDDQINAKEVTKSKRDNQFALTRTDEGKIVNYNDKFINSKGKISRDHIRSLAISSGGSGGSVSKYKPGVSDVPLYSDENDEIVTPNQRIIVPEDLDSWENTSQIMTDKLAELTGIYGFGAEVLTDTKQFKNKHIIETPSYEMSLNDAFWEKNMGGLGGEISEIYRRFFNKRSRQDYFNPIRNTQADWMPGKDYFKSFQHGDPYSKVDKGEMRIAGAGYEAMNEIAEVFEVPFTISDITKSPEKMAEDYNKGEQEVNEYIKYARKRGIQIDSQIKKELSDIGMLKETEVGVRNDRYNISGRYDATIVDINAKAKESPLEIKSVSEDAFQKIKGPDYTQIEKMNFVLNEKGYERGHIMYVNRSNPNERKSYIVTPNKEFYQNSLDKSVKARKILSDKLNAGKISKNEMYSPFHRFKILSDVAPYSDEFKHYKEVIGRMKLKPEQEREKQEILDQVDDRYNSVRLYDYRFKETDTKTMRLTVENVLRDGKITVKEFDKAIKLAGVKTSLGNEKMYKTMREDLKRGQKIFVEHGTDYSKIKQDGYLSARVVKDGLLNNNDINKMLLDSNLAEEDEDDFSSAALKVRFNKSQVAFGKTWEKMAHANTYINTKAMQVRSGLESYKRRDMYGKDFQKWSEPIDDFLIPAVNQAIESDNILKMAGVVTLGSMFGATPVGKAIGVAALGSMVLGGKIVTKTEEAVTGKKWTPDDRDKQTKYREYLDKIKYVKNKRIAKSYYQEAMKQEGFDIEKFDRDKKMYNRYFYRTSREKIPGIKDFFKAIWDEEFLTYAKKKFVDKSTRVEFKVDKIWNEQLVDFFKEHLEKGIDEVKFKKYSKQYAKSKEKFYDSDLAQKAKEYDDIAEKETMYGYDHYDNLYNVYKGMSKRDRKYMDSFKNATNKEKSEILKIAPKYLRRILQKEWGLRMEKKSNLKAYFKEHILPDTDWIGWNPLMDMKVIKTKLIKNAEMDLAEFNLWDDDVKRANEYGEIALPDIDKKTGGRDLADRLKYLLTGEEFEEVEVKYDDDDKRDLNIDLKITKDKHKEIVDKLKDIENFL